MDTYAQKLRQYIEENSLPAQLLTFTQICHSVEQAAQAVGAPASELVKNICLVDADGNLIVAIVPGESRASTTRVGKALGIETPRPATTDEVLAKTGFPCGGVPSFGYHATFVIDPLVMEKETVYTGGGSEYALTRIATDALQKANGGIVARVRK